MQVWSNSIFRQNRESRSDSAWLPLKLKTEGKGPTLLLLLLLLLLLPLLLLLLLLVRLVCGTENVPSEWYRTVNASTLFPLSPLQEPLQLYTVVAVAVWRTLHLSVSLPLTMRNCSDTAAHLGEVCCKGSPLVSSGSPPAQISGATRLRLVWAIRWWQ